MLNFAALRAWWFSNYKKNFRGGYPSPVGEQVNPGLLTKTYSQKYFHF